MHASALLRLSKALHKARSLAEVLECALQSWSRDTLYKSLYVHALHANRRSFDIVGFVVPDSALVEQRVAGMDVEQDPFLRFMHTLQVPHVIADARLEPLADQNQVKAFQIRTLVLVPMFDDDGPIGPLVTGTFGEQGVVEPTEDELNFLTQIAALVGVVITRLRAEAAQKKLQTKLASTERLEALGRFAGGIVHDFNNLLLAVMGNAELAAEDLQGHQALPYIKDITQVAEQASALTRQLLAFSKGQVLTSRVLEVTPLVESSLRSLHSLIPSGIQIESRLSPVAGAIEGDPQELARVLMNLVLNARDAIQQTGSVIVETQNIHVDEEYIANHAHVPAGRYVLLTVTDNGKGMDVETQEKVFEPFFSTKSASNGTGLGLSVAQGIISQHNGHIHVYSEVGVGTTFKVYLPICSQRASNIGDQLPEPKERLRGKERILLVDDQEHVRRTVSHVLQRAGYDVLVASTHAEAQAFLKDPAIALLLSDIVMPDVSGLELADAATKQSPNLSVLMMTGYAPAQLNEMPWAHISKPFTPTALLAKLRDVLDATKKV